MAEQENQEQQSTQEARGRGGSAFFFDVNIIKPNKKTFWVSILLIALLIAAYSTNFLGLRTRFPVIGVTTIIGAVLIFIIASFIIFGFVSGLANNDSAKIFIAIALSIWMLDLVPENFWLFGPWLGRPWAGFELPLVGVLPLTLATILTSAITFVFLYFDMIFKIIKKEYISFILSFAFIVGLNYFFTNYAPNYFRYNFIVPYGKIIFFAALVFLGWIAWKLDKKHRGTAIPDFFSSLYMISVFSFFWLNSGWQHNTRALIHVFYIILFGFLYIKNKEKDNPVYWRLLIPTLLIIDFYGYGLLYSSDYLALRYIPPNVLFVLTYCYVKESNEEEGKRKATYPVLAFILLVTFILIMSIRVAGLEGGGTVPFIAREGATFKDFYSQLTQSFREVVEGRLDIATAGLYRGNVEKNQYESLGVYFANLRAADPRFYTDEPITVWGTIRSKTYQDAVIINFSCYRWLDNKRIKADKVYPDFEFPIFTLEEIDTECTFYPKEEGKEIKPGPNIITFSAEYNFGTDAYLKTYFMDRDRFRAYARENVDPLAEFGIKDKNPVPVFTNGPVEIGLNAGPLVTVSEGSAIKPKIGVTLTNRQEIQDKDRNVITRWEGKIKNITELIILVPPGIEIKGNERASIDEACNAQNFEKGLCPCSMPFVSYDVNKCKKTCSETIYKPCEKACSGAFTSDKEKANCIEECKTTNEKCQDECDFLFDTRGEDFKGNYKGYALDVGSLKFKDLNKDIDKHRSFECRFDASSDVLDTSPITTRYLRVRARYNYLLENSVQVNVESAQQIKETVPEEILKTSEQFKQGLLYFEGSNPDLVSAIALVESSWRHCCTEAGKNKWHNCKKSEDIPCEQDRVLISYDGSSVGMMQINKKNAGIAGSVCKSRQTIYDLECNILVGIQILKNYYEQYGKNGIEPSRLAKFCPQNEQPARYNQYLSYRTIEAAIRAYNGWGCRPENSCQKACANSRNPSVCVKNCVDGTINYVPHVIDKYNKIKNGEIIDVSSIRRVLTSEDVIAIHEEESESQPSAPSSLEYSYDSSKNVLTISWTRSTSPEIKSYKVTRADGTAIDICTVEADARDRYSCEDKSLVAGTKYTYKVITTAKNGQSSTKTLEATPNK